MADAAHNKTDEMLKELEEALKEEYSNASSDLQKKVTDHFEKYKAQDKVKAAQVAKGELSQEEYNKWQAYKTTSGERWKQMQKTIAEELTHANEIAAAMINDKRYDVYALNHNYGMYEAEMGTGVKASYTLYNHDTVKRLVADKPEILPPVKIDRSKDIPWNQQKLRSAVTQGILQGESMPKIAARMAGVAKMDENAAIRNARTAVTGAENGGRFDAYQKVAEDGTDMKQVWISTLDGRTRTSHRHLMGKEVNPGEKFSNGCRFPGDPQGPANEVYNCRCRLIGRIKGIDYNLEERMTENLAAKGMTIEEWQEEQPLPRHYGETLKQYLKRYEDYRKKKYTGDKGFDAWLGDQAAPDSVIQSKWGDKKMSQIYNMIKEQNVTDANLFYKELGKLGKPSEVWSKYLTSQIDAEDLKKFEDILKKYLPKIDNASESAAPAEPAKTTPTSEAGSDIDEIKKHLPVNTAGLPPEIYNAIKDLDKGKLYSDWRAGKITDTDIDNIVLQHKANVDVQIANMEAKTKWTKGPEMSFDDADTYHVNPKYTKNEGIYSVNCQTCAFAYEARRQGYDVVALGKDPAHKGTYALQQKLAYDQREGWINEYTGKAPQQLMKDFGKNKNYDADKFFNTLNDTVGNDGERYTLSVAWKSNGAHIINVDRDANGNLRLIDNQRGKNEKHIWTGKHEIESYFKSVKHVIQVLRVDDCRPNPKYLNKIVKKGDLETTKKQETDAAFILAQKKAKVPFWGSLTSDQQKKITDHINDIGADPNGYFFNWTKNYVDDPFLDKMFGIKSEPTVGPTKSTEPAAPALDKSAFDKKKMSQVFTDIKMTDTKTANDFYKELNSQGKPSDVWSKYLNGDLDADKAKKITDILMKKYSIEQLANMGESVVGLDIETLKNKKVTGVYNDFVADGDKTTASQFYNTLKKIGAKDDLKQSEVWNKYLNGELDFDDIAKIDKFVIKKYKVENSGPDLTKTESKIDHDILPKAYVKALAEYNKAFGDEYNKFKADVEAIGKTIGKSPSETWTAYKNNELHPNDMKIIDNYVEKLYSNDKLTLEKIKTALPSYLSLDSDLYDKVSQHLTDLKLAPGGDKKNYYNDWKKGLIDDPELDKIFGIKSEPKKTTMGVDKSTLKGKDIIGDFDGKEFNDLQEALKNSGYLGYGEQQKHFEDWISGKVNDDNLDKLFGVKSEPKTTTTPTPASPVTPAPGSKTVVDLDKLKGKKVMDIYHELEADKQHGKFYNDLKKIGQETGIGKQGDVWNKYLKGELDDKYKKTIDNYVIDKYSKVVEPPKPVFDKAAFNTKKMSQVFNDIKATDTSTANKFYTTLKEMGKPSDVWDQYLNGKLPQDQADKIETILKKKYMKTPAGTESEGDSEQEKKYQAAKDNLEKAKKDLKDAEKDLEDEKKNLPPNKTYTGIWKDDVTLEDYESKKDKIEAKKIYYKDEINKLETEKNNDPTNFPSWKQKNLDKYTQYLNDLDEFQKLGEEYTKAKEPLKDLEKKVNDAKKDVDEAQKKVNDLAPAGEMYTQQRKDNAKWFTLAEYSKGDAYYSKQAKTVHKTATSAEHDAYYGYTSASGSYNRPLAGFEAPKFSGASGWNEKYFKGVGKVDLNNEGSGKRIRDLTRFVEKSKMTDDVWVQTSQNYATLEGKNGFLGIPYGTLSGMSDADLQHFVGVENQLGQFISGAINRGGGSYSPGNMKINIYLPKGSEALYVLSDGAFGKREHEIILQRGGTYKITKIYWGNDAEHGGRKLMVDMELRLERGYNKYGQ